MLLRSVPSIHDALLLHRYPTRHRHPVDGASPFCSEPFSAQFRLGCAVQSLGDAGLVARVDIYLPRGIKSVALDSEATNRRITNFQIANRPARTLSVWLWSRFRRSYLVARSNLYLGHSDFYRLGDADRVRGSKLVEVGCHCHFSSRLDD